MPGTTFDDPIPFVTTELDAQGPDPEAVEALIWAKVIFLAVVILFLVVLAPAIVAGAYRVAFFG